MPSAVPQATSSSSAEEPLQIRDLFGGVATTSVRLAQFTLLDGLPSLNINALVLAPDGLLWVGTGSGCVTFDGDRFRAIGPARDRPYGVESTDAPEVTRVSALEVDTWGHVWVAGSRGELLRYASEASEPESVPTQQASIAQLLRDSRGSIWIAGSELERAELVEGKVRLTTVLSRDEPGELRVLSIAQAPPTAAEVSIGDEGDLPIYAGTNQGLYRWTHSGGLERLDEVPRQAVFYDGMGHRWELMEDATFLMDGRPRQRWEKSPGPLHSVQHLQNGETLLAFDEDLIAHVPETGRLQRVRIGGSPRALLTERSGGIWLAAEPLGLEFFERQSYDLVRSDIPRVSTNKLASLGPETLLVGATTLSKLGLIDGSTSPIHSAEPETIDFAVPPGSTVLGGVHGAAVGDDGIRYVATGQGVRLLMAVESLGKRQASSNHKESLNKGIRSIQDSIHDIAHDVHWLSRRLHPTVLDDLGLLAALRSECARRSERATFKIEFQNDGSAKDLKGEVGLAIFRIVQEALQNVATLAEATNAIVRLHTESGELILSIEDDGCGISDNSRSGSGIGLASMTERAQLVHGKFEIGPGEMGGTIVRVTIPRPASPSTSPDLAEPR